MANETGKLYAIKRVVHRQGDHVHAHLEVAEDRLVQHGNHFHRASETQRDSFYLFLITFGVMVLA